MIGITTKNYFKTIHKVGLNNLPSALKEAHTVIDVRTKSGKDWSPYQNDHAFKKVVNLTAEKLEEYIQAERNGFSGLKESKSPEVRQAKKDAIEEYPFMESKQLRAIYALECDAELEYGEAPEMAIRKKAIEKILKQRGEDLTSLPNYQKTAKQRRERKPKGSFTDIAKECHFIERFLSFHDKIIYKNTLGIFIDDIQRAAEQKEIRLTSPVASEIMEIQNAAVDMFNKMSAADHLVLKPATIKKLKNILVRYENALDNTERQYIGEKKKSVSLQGVPIAQEVNVIPSTEFAKLKFESIGFKDPWLRFIGDPSPGFTAMVFGMPKMGKSYLCMAFAKYLALNHGRVLYISKEEFMSPTLQKKLVDKNASSENLDISGSIPADLTAYDFVFIDSVSSLKMTPEDLLALKQKYFTISFIYVFQVTKAGSARGTNEHVHNVDVVIEIPERGRAVQFGRYNQGGELNIFDSEKERFNETAPEGELQGLDGKRENWTTPKHLNSYDHERLKNIKKYADEGEFELAMELARESDTEIREAIPGEVWIAMGGQLTTSGYEKLRKRGFTTKQINKLEAKSRHGDEDDRKQDAEDSEPLPQVISFMEYSKPPYRPKGKDIYPHVSSLNEINLALSCLRGTLEGRVIKKLKVGEYLEIVKIALRKHPDLFAFTEDVSSGLNDIVLRLRDSWEDWKSGVTSNTVKPKKYLKRKGHSMNFVHSPGIDVLSIYYDKYMKKKGDKKFDEHLTEAVENDDLLYYNLAELERLFTRIKEQMSNSKAA